MSNRRINARALLSMVLLVGACLLIYNWLQGRAIVEKKEVTPNIIGTIVKVGFVDTSCTVSCANEVELTVTNAVGGYVWLTDSEGDTMRCSPSVLTPAALHPMTMPLKPANDIPVTFDGRSRSRGQIQTTIADSAKCEFAYTDMLYRGRNGLTANLSSVEQSQINENGRYCNQNPDDKACRVGRTARGVVQGFIDGLSN